MPAGRDASRTTASADPALGRSDDALLEAVGVRGDTEAFEELVGRYHGAAYRFARYLTQDHQEAEDSVQEGFLRIWRSADGFRGEGKSEGRGWILSIIARSALHRRKRRQAQRSAEPVLRGHSTTRKADGDPGISLNDAELTTALRGLLDRLAEDDRTLVALYFQAGLTQVQAARLLSIPQRTFSHRLQKILGALRRELERAGLAGAAPLDVTAALGALSAADRRPVPCDLKRRILDRWAVRPERQAGRLGAPPRSWPRGTAALAALGVCVGLALALSSKSEAPQAPTPGRPQGDSRPALPGRSAPAQSRLLKCWDFKNPSDLEDFEVRRGGWRHRTGLGLNRDGGVETTTEGTEVLLDLPLERLPFACTVGFRPVAGGALGPRRGLATYAMGAGWELDHGMVKIQDAFAPLKIVYDRQSWLTARFLIAADGIASWYQGVRVTCALVERLPGSRLGLAFGAVVQVDEIRLEALAQGEALDCSAYAEALRLIPPQERKGRVALPGLAPGYQGRPVTAEFPPP